MASPRLKREKSFDFEQPSGQEAMGSASASYSPPGGVFGLSPPDSSLPGDGRKRRKDRPSWVKHTLTPHFDGHLWRKYGQKNIKDAEYPRLYFRCSYREDKKCLASKLVQQENDDDPPLFTVTYTYEHTCGAAPVPTPDIVAEPPAAREGLVLRFDSPAGGHPNAQMQQQGPYQSTSWGPFMILSFGSSSQTHDQLPVFPSDQGAGASLSFTTEALPAPPSTNGDMFSTWDSFRYDLDDHMPFGDHVHFPYNSNDDDDNY
ncbi:probable WRKY transcription factor 4 [Phragmites australis]|uniref:probable WRKY transcription factor 4 n=1 Tax=Phragmites australis TaxID=29695 RepID=UPI002D77F0DE|nr:probable WRKY transcription factor 4 [Phragmites australis]